MKRKLYYVFFIYLFFSHLKFSYLKIIRNNVSVNCLNWIAE